MSNRIKSIVKFQWVNVLPTLISTATLLLGLVIFNLDAYILPASLGILAGSVVDLDNRFSGKLWNSIIIFSLFATAQVLVYCTYHNYLLLTVVNVIACFIYVLLGAFSKRLKTIGFGTVLFTIYSLFIIEVTPEPKQGLLQLFCMLLASLYFTLVSLVIHLLFPNRGIKNNISDLYNALSDFLLIKSSFFDPDDDSFKVGHEQLENQESFARDDLNSYHEMLQQRLYNPEYELARNQLVQQFTTSRDSLIIRLGSFAKRKVTSDMLRLFVTADNIFNTLDFNLQDFQKMKEDLQDSDIMFRIQRLLTLYAHTCQQIAYDLHADKMPVLDKRIFTSLGHLSQSIKKKCHTYPNHIDSIKLLLGRLKKIYWLLQNINKSHLLPNDLNQEVPQKNRWSWRNVNLQLIGHKILNQLNVKSPTFRHALRITLLLIISLIIFIFNKQFAFWFMLAGVLVIQPNYSNTKARVKARTIGTIWGACLGGILSLDVFGHSYFIVAVAIIGFSLFTFFRTMNYGYATGFLTVGVFSVFQVIGVEVTWWIVVERIIANVAGACLTWGIMHKVFPEWNYLDLGKCVTSVYDKNGRLLSSMLQLLTSPEPKQQLSNMHRRLIIAQNLHLSLQNLMATIAAEPKIYSIYISPTAKLMSLNDYIISNLKLIHNLIVEQLESYDIKDINPSTIGLLNELNRIYNNLYSYSEEQLKQEKVAFLAYANQVVRDEQDKEDFDVNYYIKERIVGIGASLISYRKSLVRISEISKIDQQLFQSLKEPEQANNC